MGLRHIRDILKIEDKRLRKPPPSNNASINTLGYAPFLITQFDAQYKDKTKMTETIKYSDLNEDIQVFIFEYLEGKGASDKILDSLDSAEFTIRDYEIDSIKPKVSKYKLDKERGAAYAIEAFTDSTHDPVIFDNDKLVDGNHRSYATEKRGDKTIHGIELSDLMKVKSKYSKGGKTEKKEEIKLDTQLIVVEPAVLQVLEKLDKVGSKALIVGGAVRDALQGIDPKDIDIEVYQVTYSHLSDFLSKFGKVNLVGKNFGVIKFKPKDGIMEYDFSVPRRENKIGIGHKEFSVTFDTAMTIKDAALRRDFTFNALAYDPVTNVVYDYFGGLDDLKNKIIRHTSDKFAEDPLRILRAMQFQARFDFTIAPETIKEMRKMLKTGEFETLPKERIFEEWKKWAEKGVRHDLIFKFLRDTTLINYYPELKLLKETKQDKVWHPEGDVEIHTTLCLKRMDEIVAENNIHGDEKVILVMAILFHDIAKPQTTKEEEKDGRMAITAHGHEAEGGKMVQELLPQMGFHEELVTPIANIVANHLSGVSISLITAQSGKVKAVKKLSKRLFPATIQQLLYVMDADSNGRGGKVWKEPTGAKEIKEIAADLKVTEKPYEYVLMGRHLIEAGLKPSPEFGDILRKAEEAQENGEFSTVEDGKIWLANYLANRSYAKGGKVMVSPLAPNGKPSNLNPTQWEIVRSNEFINWFGQWLDYNALLFLANGSAIHIHGDLDLKSIADHKERNRFVRTMSSDIHKEYIDERIRNLIITRKGLMHSLSHASDKPVLNAIYFLRNIIETSVEVGWKENHKIEDTSTRRYWYYVNKVIYENVAYGVVIVARESSADGQQYLYDYNLEEIKKPIANTLVDSKSTTNHDGQYKNTTLNSIYQTNPNNISKIVDTNFEPQSVFHGSSHKFNEFTRSTLGELGEGMYFTYNKSEAQEYADRMARDTDAATVYEVYLKIVNPFLATKGAEQFWKKFGGDGITDEQATQNLIEAGYDGIVLDAPEMQYDPFLRKVVKSGKQRKNILALMPNQIKLADGSNTTFDINNPDMRYEKGGEVSMYPSSEQLYKGKNRAVNILVYNGKKHKIHTYTEEVNNGDDKFLWYADAEGGKTFFDSDNLTICGYKTKKEILDAIFREAQKGTLKIEDFDWEGNAVHRMKDGGSLPLLAPNGKPTNLSPELWHLVRTPAFLKWFGDFISAYDAKDYTGVSKVIDENGEPLVVWNGSVFEHYTFDKGRISKQSGQKKDKGFAFSTKKSISEMYAASKRSRGFGYGHVNPYFLCIKKIDTYDAENQEWNKVRFDKDGKSLNLFELQEFAYKNKEDGLWVKRMKEVAIKLGEDNGEYVADTIFAFPDRSSIKLADGSNTTFGIKNLDIRYDSGGTVESETNEEAQMYIDILSEHPHMESYQKYKVILKDKFGIDFDKIYKDEELIENASLSDIKTKKDFMSWDSYCKYAVVIWKLRGFMNSYPKGVDMEINIEQGLEVGKQLGFTVKYKEYTGEGNIAYHMAHEIVMPAVLDINTFIHECGHNWQWENRYEGLAMYLENASSLYGVPNGASNEVFAENFMAYFSDPEWLKGNLPAVYKELDKVIDDKTKKVINGLLPVKTYSKGGAVYSDKIVAKSLDGMTYFKQEKNNTCSVACLRMALSKFMDKVPSEEVLAKQLKTNEETGTHPDDERRVAKDIYGMEVLHGENGTIEKLDKLILDGYVIILSVSIAYPHCTVYLGSDDKYGGVINW